MNITTSVSEILKNHVVFEMESIDRLYLNAYVPQLQRELGLVGYIQNQLEKPIPSTAAVAPASRRFVECIKDFAGQQGLPLVDFQKGQRKDDVAKDYLSRFDQDEGILFVGRAQEMARVFRTQTRHNPQTGARYPWIYPSRAPVNQFYFYCFDYDFGPFFLKFCTYFPYNAKLCINGHEYAKRQLEQRNIHYVALDNGFLSCEDPKRLQQICDGLSPAKIDALLRKWFGRLPHPFPARDRKAGYRYDLSILQAEFALTQIVDRPLTGRCFFEQVLRENLDLGRPDKVQLIFNRRVTRRTPGRFRTRVLTHGVDPSLCVDYKSSVIHQYFKQVPQVSGCGVRTETVINNTRDFAIGKRLHNLPELRQVGFQANRRLLDVQRISHDCAIGEEAFQDLQRPCVIHGHRVSALRYGDLRVQALLQALVIFGLHVAGFTNRDLRELLAPLLGLDPSQLPPGRMTYDLRRLRLRGLIQRIPHTNRYIVTHFGLRIALFYTRTHARVIRPGLAMLLSDSPTPIRQAFDRLDKAIHQHCASAKLAA